MPYAELLEDDDGKIVVTTTYADRYLIRQLPGANYHPLTQTWRVPLSWPACLTLRGLFGDDLDVGPLLASWANGEYALRVRPALATRDALTADEITDPVITEVLEVLEMIERDAKIRLLGYQRVDVGFLVTGRHGSILANPMGLGKTASVIRALQVLYVMGENPFPALVICPNTVKLTWADEIAKFAPELRATVITGPAGVRRRIIEAETDVLIVNWEALRIHSRLAPYGAMTLSETERTRRDLNERGLVTVIADEAHHAKDPHSKQTRAMWALAGEARYRWLMTGTPVASHVGDLWSLLHAADQRAFPAKSRYLERWARVELGFYGGSQVLGLNPETEAEFRAVTAPMLRRVPKEAALPQLPPKLDVIYRYTEMTPVQAKLYKQAEDDMILLVHDSDQLLSIPNAIAQLTRLLQFAAASAHVESESYEDQETGETKTRARVVLEAPSSKVDDLVELLQEMDEEPLVVGAVSTQLLNLAAARLAREGVTCGLITGQQGIADRQLAKDLFQDGRLRVILVNIDAGGEGITLTRARTVLIMQRHWSSIKNDQFIDRVHRMGQEYPVQVIDQVTFGTVEFRKLQVIAEKEQRIEEILQDKPSFLRLLGQDMMRR